MNYGQLIIESVYEFEQYKSLNKRGDKNKFFNKLKNRLLYLNSLTRVGSYYIPSKKKYKLNK